MATIISGIMFIKSYILSLNFVNRGSSPDTQLY